MKTIKRNLSISAFTALGILAGQPALESSQAAVTTTTVTAGNSGSYNSGGWANGLSGQHHITVNQGMPGVADKRGWIDFDLTSISSLDIVGAILQIPSNWRNGSGQTINFWDVLFPPTQLGTFSSTAVYADLGGGVSYGTGIHTAGVLNSFTLTSEALTAINAAEGHWAIGLQNLGNTYAFGYEAGAPTVPINLVLQVREPEPPPQQNLQPQNVPEGGSTVVMMGLAASGLVAFRRRRAVAK